MCCVHRTHCIAGVLWAASSRSFSILYVHSEDKMSSFSLVELPKSACSFANQLTVHVYSSHATSIDWSTPRLHYTHSYNTIRKAKKNISQSHSLHIHTTTINPNSAQTNLPHYTSIKTHQPQLPLSAPKSHIPNPPSLASPHQSL